MGRGRAGRTGPLMGHAVAASGVIAVHPDAAGPVAALRGLDLIVEPGELAAVVGPSGSGKTTLLRLLAGLGRATAGRLTVLDLELTTAPDAAVRRHQREVVAIVEQHYRLSLSPYLPIRESVALPLAVRGVAAGERNRRATELLERVGLGDRAEARPAELSGGEQQRVAVAAALVTRPRLLLADEPTGELDAATAEALLRLIRELVAETGTTAIVVTHDETVERVADRTVHLRDGRAIAERRGVDLRPLTDAIGWQAPPIRAGATVGTPVDEHVLPEVAHGPGRGRRLTRQRGPGVGRRWTGPTVASDRRFGRSGTSRSSWPWAASTSSPGRPGPASPRSSGSSPVSTTRRPAPSRRSASRWPPSIGTPGPASGRRGSASWTRVAASPRSSARSRTWPSASPSTVDPEDIARVRARAALEAVGLGDLVDRRPATLSAGERTRVTIARALATEPELILLDEPTATLDRANAILVGELLAGLAGPRTIIAATHDRALMEVATDRYSLERGD